MLKIAVVGLGPIGLQCAKAVQNSPGLELTGLVDVDPGKVGRTLESLLPDVVGPAVEVVSDIDDLKMAADVVILSTTSYFDRLAPTLRQCMRQKLSVVSSCEEMSWPWLNHPHLADVINAEAIKAGVKLIGTGVNPGFVMDVLPVVLSSMTLNVREIRVTRVVDALTRRLPLQRKIGATMSVEQFNKLADAHQIGHMGIGESVTMLAQGLGRHPLRSDIKTFLEPVIADRVIDCAVGAVQPGQVRGMHNVGSYDFDGLKITLDLTMALGEPNPRDEIEVIGDQTLRLLIPGSTPGDTATVAALVNVCKIIPRLSPGLKTMLDCPPAGAR